MNRRDLMLAGQTVGTVSWRVEGNRVFFSARCPVEEGRIYRIQLVGSGQTINLGVMAPQGAEFVLRRTLSLNQCRFLSGEGGAVEARVVSTLPGEEPTEAERGTLDRFRPVELGFSTGDRDLDAAIGSKADVLYLADNDMLHLAYPLKLGTETPFAPFLAATRWVEQEGIGYGLLTLPQHIKL